MLKSSVSKIGLLVNPKVLAFALLLPEKRMLLAVDTASYVRLLSSTWKPTRAEWISLYRMYGFTTFVYAECALIAIVHEVWHPVSPFFWLVQGWGGLCKTWQMVIGLRTHMAAILQEN